MRVLYLLWLSTSTIFFTFTTAQKIPVAKPGCKPTCGNVTIYYPFGIGLDGKCSLSNLYNINCNTTHYNPPKPFLGTGNLEVYATSITGQMHIRNFLAVRYYKNRRIQYDLGQSSISLRASPLVFSDTENKFIVIGCDDYAYIYGTLGRNYTSGCTVECSKPGDVINGSCSGIGCCQTSIPKGLKNLVIDLYTFDNHTNVSDFNPYSFAFIGEQDKFTFNVADLSDPTFFNRTQENVPIVLDWYVGVNQTCVQAKRNVSSYACRDNTICADFEGASGYRCSCLPGYEGNPYLKPGCAGPLLSLTHSY